jgi:hypothetical protein
MRTTAEFLTFKEYNAFGAVSKRFYDELRGSTGAKACIHFIKIRYID